MTITIESDKPFWKRYLSFLDKIDLISSAAAFVLAITANNFFITLSDEVVIKILNSFYNFKNSKLRFYDVDIDYGLILTQLIQLIVISIFIFSTLILLHYVFGWS